MDGENQSLKTLNNLEGQVGKQGFWVGKIKNSTYPKLPGLGGFAPQPPFLGGGFSFAPTPPFYGALNPANLT